MLHIALLVLAAWCGASVLLCTALSALITQGRRRAQRRGPARTVLTSVG